jgi:putative hydrolase of the HAD superfamily
MLENTDVVVWDFDGVINRNYDEHGFLWYRNLEQDHQISISDLQGELFGDNWKRILCGEIPIHGVLTRCLTRLGYNGSIQSFLEYWMERDFSIDPQILDLMQRIASTGKVQVIATNNEPAKSNLIWDGHGLKNFCSHMFSSGELGILKPDEEFFIAIEQGLGSLPHRILLIDDTPNNVDAAKQRGWKSLQYGDFTQLKLGSPQWLVGQLGIG